MVPRENKNNPYAKFGGTNKEYYGTFRSGLYNLNYTGRPLRGAGIIGISVYMKQ